MGGDRKGMSSAGLQVLPCSRTYDCHSHTMVLDLGINPAFFGCNSALCSLRV